ncbi:MAG TPA: cysteine desulfurase-like protein [Vicinamibacteria bacterium]|jgi:cysteine desulfurase family protein (TIGR01976 family)|nr:cysteine desulfurase-like protein [Vicinamibacteria bacterium]
MRVATDRTTGRVADVEAIRRHFPALERRHEGRSVAHFDGPGGTQVPRVVVEAMDDYLLHHNANTHWHFPTSLETDAALARARATLADLLGASPGEIVFGANMTTLTFHLARALGRGWGPGDEVVVTELDHHANVDPWRAVARERGLTVRVVALRPETGQLDEDDLAQALTPRTRLLAIGAASNALGTINDVHGAVQKAHAAGALVFVDAVHYTPHVLPDVRSFDCDFLACSAYKFYGPHVGVLYGRRERIEALDPPKLAPAPDRAPECLETGTQNHEGLVGAAAAVDFLASLAGGGDRRASLLEVFGALHERSQAHVERLWAGLGEIPGLTLYGPSPLAPRTPTVAFTLAGHPSGQVASALARHAVFVSHGDFYATTAVRRLAHGEDGLVRAGCACYTTREEVDRLVEAVHSVART